MFKKIGPLAFIFACTSVAWFILGSVTDVRTNTQNSQLKREVGQLWGKVQKQEAPKLYYFGDEYDTKAERYVDGEKTFVTVQSNHYPMKLSQNDITVDIDLNQRKKGLLWYSTYKVKFDGRYKIVNNTGEERDIIFKYNFPNDDGIYENFELSVDNIADSAIQPNGGIITKTIKLANNESADVNVTYQTQGLDQWWYIFGHGVSKINKFSLTMNTNFDEIDFPVNSISPTSKEKTKNGWRLKWEYSSLISGIQIGMETPHKLNPGPFVSRVSYFAPISLFLFMFLMFIITTIKKVKIHPVNYFFLACAFFSFHLLLAYMIDHINIHLAFSISTLVSIFLVISYMRLVVGTRFALIETGLSQFVYMVLFSYAFFLEGYTGLSVAILCIITLFIVMRATAKIDWENQFKSISDSNIANRKEE